MNSYRLLGILTLTFLIAPAICSQEQKAQAAAPAPTAEAASATPAGPDVFLRVQVVISESNGNQKVSSLPFTLYVVKSATPNPNSPDSGSLRMDSTVPLPTGGNDFQYKDTGTDIDCHVMPDSGSDGRYHLKFTIHRISLVPPTPSAVPPEVGQALANRSIIRNFQDSFDVMVHDGQTVEGSNSVDPVTGNVVKVDVTLNVQK